MAARLEHSLIKSSAEFTLVKYTRYDSNLQHSVPKTDALSNCATGACESLPKISKGHTAEGVTSTPFIGAGIYQIVRSDARIWLTTFSSFVSFKTALRCRLSCNMQLTNTSRTELSDE